MANYWIVSLALLCSTQLACAGMFGCPEGESSIAGCINSHLVEGVPETDDAQANIVAAGHWLRSLTKGLNGKLKSWNPLVRELKVFVSLGKINADNKCSAQAFQILKDNDRLTYGRARSNTKDPSRLELVVRQVARGRALDCADAHLEIYRKKADGADRNRLRPLSDYLDIGYIYSYVNLENLYQKYIVSESSNELVRTFLANAFRRHGAWTRTSSYRSRHLIHAELMDGCQYAVKTFGRDCFEPATFDVAFADRKHENAREREDLAAYYIHWGQYRLCKTFLSDFADIDVFDIDTQIKFTDERWPAGHQHSPAP